MADLTSRFCFAGVLAVSIAGFGLTGCDRQPATQPAIVASTPSAAQPKLSASDLYDTSEMDFKPGPATLSSERHTGPFSSGNSLSLDATLKPLTSELVKEIRLDTTHKIIEIAPGVKFSAWTFGDQVPGPVVGARVGDRIKFSMTNRSDEPAPGIQVMAAPMMHSMDFHAAMVGRSMPPVSRNRRGSLLL